MEQQQKSGGFINDEQVKALQILLQGVQVGQKRGAYSLDEAETLSKAVKQFLVTEEKKPEPPKSNLNVNDTITEEDEDDDPRVI
jgi:hypothetical protein